MTVDQDATAEASGGHLAMHSDWYPSGWDRFLPQYQSMWLCMIFGTAATRPVTGSLDEVLQKLFGNNQQDIFDRLGGGLDAPVQWLDPDDLEDLETEEEKAEFRRGVEARRAQCEGMLRAAGVPVPTTVRELADTMIALGIASEEDGVWSMPDELPRPEDVLTLPAEDLAHLQQMRQIWTTGPMESALLTYLQDNLERPAEVFTSFNILATATDMEADEVRDGLERLVEAGDIRLERGQARERVEVADLADHMRFHLVPDWEHIDENRITIRRG